MLPPTDPGTSPLACAAHGDTSRTQPYLPLDDHPPTAPDSVPPTKASDHRSAPQPGSHIGKYQIVQKLGSGGQAVVYRAVHPHLPGRDVVIKIAHAGISADEQTQLIEEGRILAGIELPGLVRVYDVDVDRGRPYVVFEFVRGRTLREQIQTRRPDIRAAVRLMLDMAGTLAKVHAAGVVHRDLKPANVLLDEAGRPRILDFGLGLSSNPWLDASPEERGTVSGTAVYMAPEQARGEASQIGPWTDVFGLAGIFYEMLTGKTPHAMPQQGETWTSMLARVTKCEIRPPHELNAAVPRGLEAIVMRGLAGDAATRYRSMEEFGAALRHWSRRGMWIGAAIGGAVLAGAAAWAIVALCRRDDSPNDERAVAAATNEIGEQSTATSPAAPVPSPSPIIALPPVTKGDNDSPFSTFSVNPAAIELRGDLAVRVWGKLGDTVKRGLSIDDPRVLPVRNGDQVHISADLTKEAFAYLLWIDTEGKVTALDSFDDPRVKLTSIGRRREIHSPPQVDQGWEITGKAGTETIILVACAKPMEAELDFGKIIGPIEGAALEEPQFHEYLDEVKTVNSLARDVQAVPSGGSRFAVRDDATRSPGKKLTLDDPILQALERLREHFEYVQAVRFAHAE